ncbi:MAG: nuclear transport factor 2 family protein [Micromonosporaceae bacterium]
MDLIALEEIRRLKYRYLRLLDLKCWDEFAEVFTADATADYGSPSGGRPLRFGNRDEIVAYMKQTLGPGLTTVHSCGQPEIEVSGDTATGIWCLEDTVIVPAHQALIRGSAYYHDRYRREDGVWKIAHIGYVRTYEAMMSYSDIPSFRLTANLWDQPPLTTR